MRMRGKALRRAWTVSGDWSITHPSAGSDLQTKGLVLLEFLQEDINLAFAFVGFNQNLL